MKYIIVLVIVILNLVNVPLNIIYLKVQKWYLPMWYKDRALYFAFAPIYWLLVGLTFLFGFSVGQLTKLVH